MMHVSAPPSPPEPPVERVSSVVRVGTAVGAGTLAALVASLPAAMRVGASGELGTARSLVALAAAALVPMIAAVAVARGASGGLRAYAGPGAGLRGFGLALFLSTMFVGLSVFGSVLRATTHHHGLAGVTFALGALFLAVGDALVCARVVSIVKALSPPVRRIVVPSILAGAAIVVFGVIVRFVKAASHDEASYAAAGTVVDVLAFLLAAIFASRPWLAGRRPLAWVGPPVAVVVLAFGIGVLRDAAVRDAVATKAPAFAPMVDMLAGK
jgi:choline-sulfatase